MPKIILLAVSLFFAACSSRQKTPVTFAEDICDCYQNVRDSVGIIETMKLMDHLDGCIEHIKSDYNAELQLVDFEQEALVHVRACLKDDSIKVIEDI